VHKGTSVAAYGVLACNRNREGASWQVTLGRARCLVRTPRSDQTRPPAV